MEAALLKLQAELAVRERRHAEALAAADSELRKQRITYEGEIERLRHELTEARASLALAQTLIKNGDAQLTRATTAIALEDAVLVVLAEGWVPVFIRRDQVLTSQRIDDAIAAARAERERTETPKPSVQPRCATCAQQLRCWSDDRVPCARREQ